MPREIEKKAIKFVENFERKQGRKPKILKQGEGYDVLSSRRYIEVKGVAASRGKAPFIIFNQYNFKALRQYKNFFLYIVYNIGAKKPQLMILKRDEILKRARFQYSWEIPLYSDDFKSTKNY